MSLSKNNKVHFNLKTFSLVIAVLLSSFCINAQDSNLIAGDDSDWADDGSSGSTTNYNHYYGAHAQASSRAEITGPYGNPIVAWKATTTTSMPHAGVYHKGITVETDKTYRLAYWVKRSGATGCNDAAGFLVRDNINSSIFSIARASGTTYSNTNPHISNNDAPGNEWVLVVGYLRPSTSSAPGGTGMYDPNLGTHSNPADPLSGPSIFDWYFPSSELNVKLQIRTLIWACPSGVTTYTYGMRIEEINNMMPLNDLIYGVPSNNSSSTSSSTVSAKINSSAADGEQQLNTGTVRLNEAKLELGKDPNGNSQAVGLHFENLNIPVGATIDNAYIQFTTDSPTSGPVTVEINAELNNSPTIWNSNSDNIFSRQPRTSNVNWVIDDWTTAGERGIDQRTDDLSNIIQELVSQSGYTSNSSLNLILKRAGGNNRIAESFEGDSSNAPELFVTYSIDSDDPSPNPTPGDSVWNPGTNGITYNGNVGIGVTNPDAPLTVNGRIHSTEVKVDMQGALVPDYVFLKDYNLKTLEELELAIKELGHLPKIPSAKEMQENGMELKSMNLNLLEKIEELTLYIIQQNKLHKQLEERIQALEAQK